MVKLNLFKMLIFKDKDKIKYKICIVNIKFFIMPNGHCHFHPL